MKIKILTVTVLGLLCTVNALGSSILIPSPHLTQSEFEDYSTKENSFIKEFCRINESETNFSKTLNTFLDQPTDSNFEIYIKSFLVRKNDQKILIDYLEKFSNTNLLKKYKKIFSLLENLQSDCLNSSINIFGYFLKEDDFENLIKQLETEKSTQNTDLLVLKYTNRSLPTVKSLKGYLLMTEKNITEEHEPFIIGTCDSAQINDIVYEYFHRQTKFEYYFGSSCEYNKPNLINEVSNKRESIFKNKVVWIGASILIGGFLLSKNNKELVFEY